MSANLGGGHSDRPAATKPAENIDGLRIKVGAQERLRFEFVGNVVDQDLADRDQATWMMPESGAGDDLDHPLTTTITSRHLEGAPPCFWIGPTLDRSGLKLYDHGWEDDGAGAALYKGFAKPHVES
jgi:hypothetical protein